VGFAVDPKGAGGGCGGGPCAVTGAEDGFHGLPSGVPLAQQQEIDRIANGVTLRAAPVVVAGALFPEVVASLASNPLGRAMLALLGMNLNLQAASDGLPVGGSGVMTVGRWMSREELALMQSTGRVVEGAGGSTYVATSGAQSFMKQAQPGSVYVQFGVPKTSLLQGGQADWFKMIGPSAPRSMQFLLQKQGGEMLPKVQNLSDVLVTK
jgi:hypothetical protein